MVSQIIFFVIIFLYVYYIFVMENNNKKTYKIVLSNNQKVFGGPCGDLKKNLATCMKNSDHNILECQSVRNSFEQCLEKHFHHLRNE